MSSKMLNIVYCLNASEYMSILVSVQSVINFNSNNFINFYFIMDETFDKDLIELFRNITKNPFSYSQEL